MPLASIKATVALLWVSAVCIAGLAGYLSSPSGWTVLTGVAILPPLVTIWWWNPLRHRLFERFTHDESAGGHFRGRSSASLAHVAAGRCCE